MAGHVFHPGHSALHGMTVVVETRYDRVYVGRYDQEDKQGVHMLDVGVYDPASAPLLSKDDYLTKCSRFGIPQDLKHLLVPAADIVRITRLSEITPTAS